MCPDPAKTSSIALLLVRVGAGGVLFPHGLFKLLGGVSGFAGALASRGWPAPTVLAWCATLAELVGGGLMVVGLFTRPAAAAAAVTMLVAWTTSHLGDLPKIGQAGGAAFEYPFLLMMCALAIAIAGPGRYSLDARVGR
jgi:putative oxidoreductase